MLLSLAWREHRRRPLSLGLLVGLGVLSSLLLCGASALLRAAPQLVEAFLQRGSEQLHIDVFPRPARGLAGIGFERPVLSPADVTWLRQCTGLQHCLVIHAVPIPATIFLEVPGLIDSEQFLALYAISEADLPEEVAQAWRGNETAVPFLFNPQVIRYYNLGMADRYHLPRLDYTAIAGRNFGLLVGVDLFKRLPGHFQTDIQVAGRLSAINPWGIALPKRITDRWLDTLFPHGRPPGAAPIQARLTAASPQDQIRLRRLIEERGLQIGAHDPLADLLVQLVGFGRLLLGALAILLLTITFSAVAVVNAGLVNERQRQIAIYRLCGARFWQLLVIFAAGSAGALILAAEVGFLLATLLVPLLLDPLVQYLGLHALADQTWLPQNSWLIAAVLSLACAVGGTLPALLSLRQRPLLSLSRSA